MFVVGYDVDACGGVSVIVEGGLAGSGLSGECCLSAKGACYVIHTPAFS